MTTSSVSQNATPPQWLPEVKENFVAASNKAQSELASLGRKIRIIDDISMGLQVIGVASLITGIAVATFAAAVIIPCLLLGSAVIPIVISCVGVGGAVLGIGLVALGMCIGSSKMKKNYSHRILEKTVQADAIERDVHFLDRFTSENLLRSVDSYKNNTAYYSIDLYRYKYHSELFKENIQEINVLKGELSQYIDSSLFPNKITDFNENVFKDHLNQIHEADHRERCRQLLNRIETTAYTAACHWFLGRQANERFMQYVQPGEVAPNP